MSDSDINILRKKIALSGLGQLISKFGIIILSIFTLKYSTNILGADLYGQYAVVISYVSIFLLFTDLGLSSITSRELSKHPENSERILGNSFSLRSAISIILIPIVIVLGFLLYNEKTESIKFGIALMAITLLFSALQSTASTIFTSRTRSDIPAYINLLNKLTYLLSILAVGALGLGFYGFIYASIFAAIISTIVSIVWSSKLVKIKLRYEIRSWKNIVIVALPLGIIQIVNVIYYKIDTLMLSIFRSADEVGAYFIAYGVIDIAMSIPSMLMLSLMPTMSTARSLKKLIKITEKAFYLMLLLSLPLTVFGAIISSHIILFISSPQFISAAQPLSILLIGCIFSYLNYVFGFAAVSINKQAKMLKVSLATIAINIMLNLYFIPHYGITGAATATFITEIIALIAIYNVFKNETGFKINFLKIWKPIFSIAVTAPIGLLITNVINLNIITALLMSCALVLMYGIILAVLKAYPEDVLVLAKIFVHKAKSMIRT
ncbi:MAG TPA: flippase [Candidatus Saccharimonadales bacterium]|jgi:O-antigen/teichoic acid export membrane protein